MAERARRIQRKGLVAILAIRHPRCDGGSSGKRAGNNGVCGKKGDDLGRCATGRGRKRELFAAARAPCAVVGDDADVDGFVGGQRGRRLIGCHIAHILVVQHIRAAGRSAEAEAVAVHATTDGGPGDGHGGGHLGLLVQRKGGNTGRRDTRGHISKNRASCAHRPARAVIEHLQAIQVLRSDPVAKIRPGRASVGASDQFPGEAGQPDPVAARGSGGLPHT